MSKKILGINGKTVDITNIANKSKAQFAAELKQAGVIIDDERLESVYNSLHEPAVDEAATAGMTDEEKQAYFDKKYPEQAAKRAEYEAQAEKMRQEAEVKAKAKLNSKK